MEIRPMRIDDYEALYQLWLSCPGMGLNDLDDSREGIAAFLERNPATCFVAAEGETIAGCILVGTDGRRAYVYHTAVHPGLQRQGLGRQLVERALQAVGSWVSTRRRWWCSPATSRATRSGKSWASPFAPTSSTATTPWQR